MMITGWRGGDLTAHAAMPWLFAVAATASVAVIAVRTGSIVAWAACALILAMGALSLMVLAHSPVKTVAEILRDVETR